jgi:hypothetical protein
MRVVDLVGCAFIMVYALTCVAADLPIDSKGKLTLALARQPSANEMLVIEVSVGVIGRGTKIVIRAPDKKIAGTIVPFGVLAGQKAGMHRIPVPAKAVADKKVTLQFEVLEKGAKTARAPTRLEIEDAKLGFIPVSKRPAEPSP